MGLFRQVLDGRLPMWDPYQFGGWPGLANCEAGLFYPPNWATVPFSNSPMFAFQIAQWLVLLHLFIVGFGTYRYSRYIGLSPLSSCFASFALTFCGFLCAHKKHTNMIFTLAWFPWLLLQGGALDLRAFAALSVSLDRASRARLSGRASAIVVVRYLACRRAVAGFAFSLAPTGLYEKFLTPFQASVSIRTNSCPLWALPLRYNLLPRWRRVKTASNDGGIDSTPPLVLSVELAFARPHPTISVAMTSKNKGGKS